MDLKRKASESVIVPFKKPRNEIVPMHRKNLSVVQSGIPRTSNLEAPIMLLTGHEGDIFTGKFSPDGRFLATSGFDRMIFFWNVYGECDNLGVLRGHTGAVMEVHFSTDGSQLFTASTDKNLAIWDVEAGARIKKLKGHQDFLWDSRKRGAVQTFQNVYQVTSVTFSDTAEQIISGGIDNDIKVWDLRKNDILYRLRGHTDTPTGLELSPDGSYLLSNGMDGTVRIWDVRPFAPQERCLKLFQGHQHSFEKNLLRCSWSSDGRKISAGSGDRFVYIWDTATRQILYKLPGHTGSVNEVDFHPHEPIVMSCSSDKKIYLGEIA
ncbi:small nuclear ribonucleoprotein 40 kDa protein-like [Octopus vulgaris]|uniref:Small nuclear ribonucleoprotein 40 kDa protein-like n=1 Tax=Octopus vulgaris TaxID=6645 RepID=A0AA36F7W7_OCTVU|nr:small nuclear ribonucleoprotein 40 kDa protein-like [Octopus vulgaris]